MATTLSTNNSGASRTMPTEFMGLINLPHRAGEGARFPVRMGRTHGFDPLTRPAPADEDAGCGPPSPPKGRGKEIRIPHPLSIHPCRRTNVETPGSRKQACGRESGSQLAGGQSALAVGNRASKLLRGNSRKQACRRLEVVHFGALQQESHPSPPGGGKEIRVPHPLSIHPCRRTNVETPAAGFTHG